MRRIIASLSLIVFILTISASDNCFGMRSVNIQKGKGLYFYGWTQLTSFLRMIGYPDYQPKSCFDIRRNAVGTELLFIDIDRKKRTALVISCNGSIKEIDIPSSLVWLNDEHQALAWVDYKDWQVHYKGGQTENTPFIADNRADPSGVYFMKIKSLINRDKVNSTSIYSIDTPLLPLTEVMNFFGERIFSKGNKVYVFGSYYGERDKQSDMRVFERKGKALIQIKKVIIPRPRKSSAPFVILDFSPWDDEVLCADTHDMGRADLYTFNLKTYEMKKIGKEPFGGGCGIYLRCDIITKVTEERKIEDKSGNQERYP